MLHLLRDPPPFRAGPLISCTQNIGSLRSTMNLFQPTDAEREVVVAAYAKSVAQRKASVDCYTAAVDALRRLYPGVDVSLVATVAVKVLTTDTRLVDVARHRRDADLLVR